MTPASMAVQISRQAREFFDRNLGRTFEVRLPERDQDQSHGVAVRLRRIGWEVGESDVDGATRLVLKNPMRRYSPNDAPARR